MIKDSAFEKLSIIYQELTEVMNVLDNESVTIAMEYAYKKDPENKDEIAEMTRDEIIDMYIDSCVQVCTRVLEDDGSEDLLRLQISGLLSEDIEVERYPDGYTILNTNYCSLPIQEFSHIIEYF